MKNKLSPRAALAALVLLTSFAALRAQSVATDNNLAPGSPGHDAQWTNAGKDGVGTSNTVDSKVWFTLRDGALTEVYYPTVDVANTRVLQFVVVSDDGRRVETEEEDTTHRVEVADPQSLTFSQVNTAKTGAYTITKTYVTDPERSSVLIDVTFRWNTPGPCRCNLYVYYDLSLNNSGMHDSAWMDGDWLVASDADKSSALTVSDPGFRDETNGYFETSDGLTQLRREGRVTRYLRAADGNVVQMARIPLFIVAPHPTGRFTLVLSFGRSPD